MKCCKSKYDPILTVTEKQSHCDDCGTAALCRAIIEQTTASVKTDTCPFFEKTKEIYVSIPEQLRNFTDKETYQRFSCLERT